MPLKTGPRGEKGPELGFKLGTLWARARGALMTFFTPRAPFNVGPLGALLAAFGPKI